MTKLTISIILFFFCVFNYAQSLDKGRVQINFGGGPYFGKTTSSHIFNNGNSINGGENSFFTLHNDLSIQINTHKNFSMGVYFSSTNRGDTDSSKFSLGSFGFNVQYYIVNKPNLNLYFDARVGGVNYSEFNTDKTFKDEKIYGKGSLNAFGLGVNKYFGSVIGVYLKSGFMRQAIQLQSFTVNDGDVETVNINKLEDIKTMYNGVFITLGLTVKLRNKSPKSE